MIIPVIPVISKAALMPLPLASFLILLVIRVSCHLEPLPSGPPGFLTALSAAISLIFDSWAGSKAFTAVYADTIHDFPAFLCNNHGSHAKDIIIAGKLMHFFTLLTKEKRSKKENTAAIYCD